MVLGFAFPPAGREVASTLGRLTILQVRVNPGLAMGDELLKEDPLGQLVRVLGEPDMDVKGPTTAD